MITLETYANVLSEEEAGPSFADASPQGLPNVSVRLPKQTGLATLSPTP